MMAAGNPNWWRMQDRNPLHSATGQPSSLLYLLQHQFNLHGGSSTSPSCSSSSSTPSSSCSSSTSSLPFSPLMDDHSVPQDFPHSWSQLLLNGIATSTEEERSGLSSHLQGRKMDWEGNLVINHPSSSSSPSPSSLYHTKVNTSNGAFLAGHHHHHQYMIKQEVYGHGHGHDINHHHHHQEAIHPLHTMRPSTWSQLVLPASSPKSCVTALSSNNNNNNLLDFSSNSCKERERGKPHVEHSSECNSPATTGVVSKKPRVQSSSIPPLKVRKEKLGDRITALHQLVSPFGKTDTASVLLEAIVYIRFLQSQIEALSSPYLGNASSKTQHSNYAIKDGSLKDLRSRGLCLVPTSCTQLVGSDNNTGPDYWAPTVGGGF